MRFVAEKIDVEATQGEIDQIILHSAPRSVECRMSDSTGVVKNAAVSIRGLEKGEYSLAGRKLPESAFANGTLRIELPIGRARRFKIEKKLSA